MKLPIVISDFYNLKNSGKDSELLTLFTSNAQVIDGGEKIEIQGLDQIKQWIEKSISGLKLHSDIKKHKKIDGIWVIDTIMSGDFKGSPAMFQYFITLTGEKISQLRVEFMGFVN